MAGLREIQGQIRSVQNTAKLTNAMKMVAAVRLGRLEERTRKSAAYHDAFEGLFHRVMEAAGVVDNPLAAAPVGGRHLFVLVSGDRGLCGPYNANALGFLTGRVGEMGLDDDDFLVATVGRKGRSLASHRRLPLDEVAVEDLSIDLPVATLRDLASRLTQGYLGGRYRAVEIVYTRFESQTRHVPASIRLLPFSLAGEGDRSSGDTEVFEPDAATIVERLIPMAVHGLVFRALQEALTSEQAARMMAMTQATDNANDVIKDKQKLFNKLRQEAITNELIDIVGGAAAVEG